MKDFKQKPLIGLDDLNDTNYSLQRLSQKEAGSRTGKILGDKNAKSGHMKTIQKIGAPLGGKVGGVIIRDNGKLKEHSKLGNLANIEKYGKRIVAYKKGSETPEYFDSIRLAERKLGIQAPLIRNVLRGVQQYSKGYRFEYSTI